MAPGTKWLSIQLRHDQTTADGDKYKPILGFLERSHCKLTVDDLFFEVFRCLIRPIIQEMETVIFSSPRVCNETIRSFVLGQGERIDIPQLYGWFNSLPGTHSNDNKGHVGWSPRFRTNLDHIVLSYERSCSFVNWRSSTP